MASTVVPCQVVGLEQSDGDRGTTRCPAALVTTRREQTLRPRVRSGVRPRRSGAGSGLRAFPIPCVMARRVSRYGVRSLGPGAHAGHAAILLAAALFAALVVSVADAATYYVRQTVGDDANDGLTPATAWKHFSRLSPADDRGRHRLRRARPLPGAGLGRARRNARGSSHLHRGHHRPAHRRSAGGGDGGRLGAGRREDLRPGGATGGVFCQVPRLEGVGRGRDGRPPATLRERPDHAREPGGEDAAGGHRGEAAVELVLRRRRRRC